MKRSFLVFIMWLLPVSLLAQQARTGINGFEFVAPLQIAGGRDNNFLVDRTNPNEKLLVLSLPASVQAGAADLRPKQLDDTVFMVTLPKIAYHNTSRRHEFIATWVPEFEIFAANGDQNGMNQQALGVFNYYLRRNVQLSIGDTYRTSKDPARELSNVFLLLPRSPYRENDFQASVDFQPSRVTNFEVRYDTGWAKFGQTDPFQALILDAKSSGYSVSLTRMLGKKHRIRGRYSLYTITPINQRKTFDDAVDTRRAFQYPISNVAADYRVAVNPTTTVDLTAGLTNMDTGTHYNFRGSFYKKLGYYYMIAGSYQRTLAIEAQTFNAFAPGLDSHSFYDVVTARFRGQPTPRTAVRLDAMLSSNVSSRFVESGKALMGRLRLDYRLDERRVVFWSWESFQQTRNPYVRSSLARNRLMMGIEFSLSDESQRRTSRINQDADYVALTDHARRRRALEED